MNEDQNEVWNILKNVPIANTHVRIEDDSLACPYCDSDYLHQAAVEVFFRKNEDSIDGIKTTSTGGSVLGYVMASSQSNDAKNGNPSSRRDGIVIKFICENCCEDPELLIYQHEGQTFIKWKKYL